MRRIKSAFFALMVVSMAIVGAVLPISAAQAAGYTATITGVVTDTAGAPVAGISVSEDSGSVATTDAAGKYTLTSVYGPDTTSIDFYDSKNVYKYTSLDGVVVGDGATVAAPTVVMKRYATISGTVTNSAGAPLAGIRVYDDYNDGSVLTDAAGKYTVTGIGTSAPAASPISVELTFSDPNGIYVTDTLEVDVSESAAVANANAKLLKGATIAGTVTGSDGTKLRYADVQLYKLVDDQWDTWGSRSTDSMGAYKFTLLGAGTYKLRFSSDDGNYLREFFSDAATLTTATEIVLSEGAADTKDAVLTKASHITGVVTNLQNLPLKDVQVTATPVDDNGVKVENGTVGYGWTNATGAYDVTGLAAGNYELYFEDDAGVYVSEYHADTTIKSLSTKVAVAASATTSGINAQLAKGSTISGKVVGASGQPLPDVRVTALKSYSGDWDSYARATTKADGTYTIKGLEAGSYKVEFSGSGLLGEYHSDAREVKDGTAVAVGVEAAVTGIDAQLLKASSISGKVTDSAGVALGGMYVTAYEWNEKEKRWDSADSTRTDNAGKYQLLGLYPGKYRLAMGDSEGDYASIYYGGSMFIEGATDITLAAEGKATADAALVAAGHITGTLTTVGAMAVRGATVDAYAVNPATGRWERVTGASSKVDGSYDIDGLAAGTYRLRFKYADDVYVTEFFDNVATIDKATDIVVAAGATVAGKNAELALTVGTVPPAPTVTKIAVVKKPVIKGTAKVGKVLKVTAGTFKPSTVTRKYQWLANGKAIAKATKAKFKLTKKQKGKKIAVRVTVSATGYTGIKVTTKATAKVK